MSTRSSDPAMKSAFCALASLVLLSACMGGGSGPAHSAEYAPSFAPSAPPQQQVANGAIYQASYGYAPLTSGARASMVGRSEEHTSELQSLMRISYAVFCLQKKKKNNIKKQTYTI